MSAANSGARNTSVEARSRQIVMFALRLRLNESSQKVIAFKLTGHMEDSRGKPISIEQIQVTF